MQGKIGMQYVFLKKPFYVNYKYEGREQRGLFVRPNHLFLEHPEKNGNFCYINNGRALEDIEERIEKGNILEKGELSSGAKKQLERVLVAVNNCQKEKEVFNKEVKLLFELMNEGKK